MARTPELPKVTVCSVVRKPHGRHRTPIDKHVFWHSSSTFTVLHIGQIVWRYCCDDIHGMAPACEPQRNLNQSRRVLVHHWQRKPLAKSRCENSPALCDINAKNSLSQWPSPVIAVAKPRKYRRNSVSGIFCSDKSDLLAEQRGFEPRMCSRALRLFGAWCAARSEQDRERRS
jgi:hypothetical protein